MVEKRKKDEEEKKLKTHVVRKDNFYPTMRALLYENMLL